MTRSFHIDIEIDELKHDEDELTWINEELNKRWLERAVETALEDENITADVFAQSE